MSVHNTPLPPTGIPTPEAVRRMQKARARAHARKPTSLIRKVLVKNAYRVEKLRKLERRSQHAAARPHGRKEAQKKAAYRGYYQIEKGMKELAEQGEAKKASFPSQATYRGYYETERGMDELAEHAEAKKASMSLSPTLLPSNISTDTDDTTSLFAAFKNTKTKKNRPSAICQSTRFNMPDLDLEHVQGDVISLATDHSVIVHACNCIGAWGSGIALQLRSTFPAAYAVYAAHCKASNPTELLGTCLLIPPQPDDNHAKPVWIACLFTSAGYFSSNRPAGNPGRSHKRDIVTATATALTGFLSAWRDARARAGEGDEGRDKGDDDETNEESPDSAVFSPKFNAGSFRVNWDTTEEQVLQTWKGVAARWTVVSR